MTNSQKHKREYDLEERIFILHKRILEEIRNISQFVICSTTLKHARNAYAFSNKQ